jgi:NADPH:quinone reductase-like Zn-dependent oxidoreductase
MRTYMLIAAGTIIGCDFSGTVVKLGSSAITRVKIGDTVAGFEQGGMSLKLH